MLLAVYSSVLWMSWGWNGTQTVAPESVPAPYPVEELVSQVGDCFAGSIMKLLFKWLMMENYL